MRSTLGKVSAIMVLLTFLIGSILVLNIVRAQNDTVSSNSVNVLEIIAIDDVVGNGTVSEDLVLGRILQNISLVETIEIATLIDNDETSSETSPEPEFNVSLGSGRITRGETVALNAFVLNSNSLARGVYFDWVLPSEFEIVSGDLRKECGDLDTEDSCYSEIGVMIDPSTEIGLNEVKIVVNYEE